MVQAMPCYLCVWVGCGCSPKHVPSQRVGLQIRTMLPSNLEFATARLLKTFEARLSVLLCIRYELKQQEAMTCGGSYVKLLSKTDDLDLVSAVSLIIFIVKVTCLWLCNSLIYANRYNSSHFKSLMPYFTVILRVMLHYLHF